MEGTIKREVMVMVVLLLVAQFVYSAASSSSPLADVMTSLHAAVSQCVV